MLSNTYTKSRKTNFNFLKVLLLIFNIAYILSAKKKNKTKSTKPKRVKNNYTSRVINLTDENFSEFNKTNQIFYLLFTKSNTTKCKKCKIFKQDYEEVSDILYNSKWKVPCAQINIDQNPNLKSKYEIKKAPRLFFANYPEEDFHEYHGRNTPKSLISYINQQLNYTTQEIQKWDQLLAKKKNGMYLIFIGDIEKYSEIYKRVIKASKEEEIDNIMWSKSDELHEKFNVPKNSFDAVMIEKKKKTGAVIKGNLNVKESHTQEQIENLMEIFERKLWGKTDEYSLLLALESNPPTPAVFLIYSNKRKDQKVYNAEINTVMEKLSKKYIREFHFMNFTYGSHLASSFISTLNLNRNNTPYLILAEHNENYEDDVNKYIFPIDQQINEENVEKFLQDFKDKKLKKYLFSDPIHVNGTFRNGIHNLVGNDYENFLFKETIGKDVIFYLYSEFENEINEKMINRMENTIKKLDGNSHLVFARSNPLFNELQEFNFEELPSLFLISGNSESQRRENIKRFTMGNYTTKNFVEFIKSSSSQTVYDKPLPDEEDLFNLEENEEFDILDKDSQEDLIDYDIFNSGLRRTTRHILEEDDDEDDEDMKKEKTTKKKPKVDTRRKDDL